MISDELRKDLAIVEEAQGQGLRGLCGPQGRLILFGLPPMDLSSRVQPESAQSLRLCKLTAMLWYTWIGLYKLTR